MKNNSFLALICLVLAGCETPLDNWRYQSFNQNTNNQYYKGDCFISCSYNHFVLFQQIDGRYIKVNEFKTLELAKKAAGNLNK